MEGHWPRSDFGYSRKKDKFFEGHLAYITVATMEYEFVGWGWARLHTGNLDGHHADRRNSNSNYQKGFTQPPVPNTQVLSYPSTSAASAVSDIRVSTPVPFVVRTL